MSDERFADASGHEARPLAGEVALVTGGGRGLGRAYALALAQAGAAVAVTARTASELLAVRDEIARQGGRALAFPADVTDPGAVAELTAAVEEQLGPVSLLINSAGVLRAIGRAAEIDADVWWREVEINLRGPFLCCRAVLPGMIARRRGCIINVVSVGGLYAFDGFSAYTVSKAALIRLTENLAIENQEHGVAVFAMHPGNIRTAMTEYLHDSEEVRRHASWMQEYWQQLFAEKKDTPIERSVALVLQLATGAADALSGRFISAEDDLAEIVQRAEEIQRDDLYALRLREPDQG